MRTITSVAEMIAVAEAARGAGRMVGLVPTMGFLHVGHVSLMTRLRAEVDVLITSIFVNPLQFGPTEDLGRYPRDPEGDARKCADAGVDLLFIPDPFYPESFSTSVAVADLTERLCGASRPTHFGGVTTVVARLFGVTRCDAACFGEKDFQQLMVIRRMVRDLALPVRIVPGPLVRDDDGVALSSRNAYLSADQRRRGRSLHQALFAVRDAVAAGERRRDVLLALAARTIDCDRVDYVDLVDAETLLPVDVVEGPSRVLGAAYYGATRLIDNVAVGPELTWT
ncbi:MAG: pantoate--beta-alanine ligase [Myxococcota bacterium]|jgi:pantoate--beta-alanine ligase